MHITFGCFRIYPFAILPAILIASIASPVHAQENIPRSQEFVITAYYSPLPDQCCYAEGSYEADIAMNGEGIRGADGTNVYVGMLAAPPSYPFGAHIDLPGLGVGAVHDRGSKIQVLEGGAHRIDIWMGYGEEGLARSLAWGVKRLTGTVYDLGTELPAESFSIDHLATPVDALVRLPKADPLHSLEGLAFGKRSFSVRILQQVLRDRGYFDGPATGQYGEVTKEALAHFQRDFGIEGDGSIVDLTTHAMLIASAVVGEDIGTKLPIGLASGATGNDVRLAQRLLRFLGFYHGRTDGVFGSSLKEAVVRYQMNKKVIQSSTDPGAGRIGPATHREIEADLYRRKVRSASRTVRIKLVLRNQIRLALKNALLSRGDFGERVAALQRLLAELGYFPSSLVNGIFGAKTRESVLAFQLKQGIVSGAESFGAGNFGPATKESLIRASVELALREVREKGMSEE